MLTDEEVEAKMRMEYQQYLADERKYLQTGGFSREEIEEVVERHKSGLGQASTEVPAAVETESTDE